MKLMIRMVAKLMRFSYISGNEKPGTQPAGTMNRIGLERELINGFLDSEPVAHNTINSWITAVLSLRSWHSSIRAARDDIRQEVLMALTENLRRHRYKGKGLKTYVCSITKYTCLKVYDRSVRAATGEQGTNEHVPSTLEKLIRDEELRAVRHAVRQLKLRCRKLLAMRYYNSMSHAQIADAFGIAAETSRQWLKRCLDRLRELADKTKNV